MMYQNSTAKSHTSIPKYHGKSHTSIPKYLAKLVSVYQNTLPKVVLVYKNTNPTVVPVHQNTLPKSFQDSKIPNTYILPHTGVKLIILCDDKHCMVQH